MHACRSTLEDPTIVDLTTSGQISAAAFDAAWARIGDEEKATEGVGALAGRVEALAGAR